MHGLELTSHEGCRYNEVLGAFLQLHPLPWAIRQVLLTSANATRLFVSRREASNRKSQNTIDLRLWSPICKGFAQSALESTPRHGVALHEKMP